MSHIVFKFQGPRGPNTESEAIRPERELHNRGYNENYLSIEPVDRTTSLQLLHNSLGSYVRFQWCQLVRRHLENMVRFDYNWGTFF